MFVGLSMFVCVCVCVRVRACVYSCEHGYAKRCIVGDKRREDIVSWQQLTCAVFEMPDVS